MVTIGHTFQALLRDLWLHRGPKAGAKFANTSGRPRSQLIRRQRAMDRYMKITPDGLWIIDHTQIHPHIHTAHPVFLFSPIFHVWQALKIYIFKHWKPNSDINSENQLTNSACQLSRPPLPSHNLILFKAKGFICIFIVRILALEIL